MAVTSLALVRDLMRRQESPIEIGPAGQMGAGY